MAANEPIANQSTDSSANCNNNSNFVNNGNSNDKPKAKSFANVVISLENCILPEDKLWQTPSMTDGLQYEHEVDLRIIGCELIQTSGILLRLPQVAMATGQVLFQRYYYCKSFVRYPMEITAMACVTLASKIEEAPRRIRDVINVFDHIKQMRLKSDDKPLVLDEKYIALKNDVIKAERRLLKELGFCVHVKHPHKFIVTLLQMLENEKNHQLMQTSWNYMNDSLRTNVFVRYSPETIACASIYLSARVLGVPLPNRPNWFEVFGVSEKQIQDVCVSILRLYCRPKPSQEELEKVVEKLRKDYDNSKLRARESTLKENGNPNQFDKSPTDRQNNSRTTSPIGKSKSDTVSPKNKLKSITSVVSQASSPKKSQTESSPKRKKSRSKSRSVTPITKDKSYHGEKERQRERHGKERERSPPKSYEYSRSGSQSPDKNGRHNSHHKHKRITFSRSRSRSPVHSHRHNHHNSKHHSYSIGRKSRRENREEQRERNDRNVYYSRSRRSRSREPFKYCEPYRRS